MNLFILGNGFDVAHGIKSNYSYFREYISKKENHYDRHIEINCGNQLMKNFRKYEVVNALSILRMAIDEVEEDAKWTEFERYLGKVDFCKYLIPADSGEDTLYIRETNQNTLNHILETAIEIGDFFSEWVQTIPMTGKPLSDFELFLREDSAFLIFNYTDTAEKLYNINKNVFHIHGKQGTDVIVGHGEDIKQNDIESIYPGTSVGICEIQNQLKKPVEGIIDSEPFRNFIALIKSNEIEGVYSYGFSFGEVDMPYIKEICKSISKETTWYFNDYSSKKEMEKFREKLEDKCGFNGRFDTFHIEK